MAELMQLEPRSRWFNHALVPKVTRWPCRCRYKSCEVRQTKSQHPDRYIRPPKCKHCGRRGTLRVDWYRLAREWGAPTCACPGYSHPHRPGSGRCDFNRSIRCQADLNRYVYR